MTSWTVWPWRRRHYSSPEVWQNSTRLESSATLLWEPQFFYLETYTKDNNSGDFTLLLPQYVQSVNAVSRITYKQLEFIVLKDGWL